MLISRYRSSAIQLIPVIFRPHDLVIRYAALLDETSPSGPRVSFRHADEQIPLSIHTPQHITFAYLSNTFMITLLRCDG